MAVTITAATSRVRTSCELVESPNVCRMFWIVFEVKTHRRRVAGLVEARHDPVADQLVARHALHARDVLEPHRLRTGSDGHQEPNIARESSAVVTRAHGECCITTSVSARRNGGTRTAQRCGGHGASGGVPSK